MIHSTGDPLDVCVVSVSVCLCATQKNNSFVSLISCSAVETAVKINPRNKNVSQIDIPTYA